MNIFKARSGFGKMFAYETFKIETAIRRNNLDLPDSGREVLE